MYKRILLPIDASSCSEQTVRWGVTFAAAIGAEVTFLHVLEVATVLLSSLPTSATYLDDLLRDMRAAGKRSLEDAEREARAQGVACDAYMLEDQNPAHAILEAEKNYHLTLMATHSRHGIDRLFIGSVTEAVLRQSEKPHLILRCPDEGVATSATQTRFEQLLLPTDGSLCSDYALGEGLHLAKTLGARVVLLHALEVPLSVYTMTDSMVIEPSLREAAQKAAQETLQKARQRADELGVEAAVRLVDSPKLRPEEAIVEAEAEAGVDLTVMGTHGRRGLTRLMLGSVTEQVLRQSPTPHLVVRCPKR